MRIKNNSPRTIALGGTVRILPGQEINLAADAQGIIDRPLVKAYLSDKTLSVVEPGKATLTADRRKAKPETDAA